METFHYPLLCWKLGEDNLCGLVVGEGQQFVGGSAKEVRTAAAQAIQRRLLEEPWDMGPELEKAKLTIVNVECRPSYRGKGDDIYPSPGAVVIPVAAVHGKVNSGEYVCQLPQLNLRFRFTERNQLQGIVKHFARHSLSDATPEDLYQYLLHRSPWLEIVTVRIKVPEKPKARRGPSASMARLDQLAQRQPPARALKKSLSAVPTAAWERGDEISAVCARLAGGNANLMVVGDPGVGKTAVLNQAITRVYRESRKKKDEVTFWKTTPHRLLSGARYLGEWQENCEELVEDLALVSGVLWIDGIVELLRVGGEDAEDSVAAFLLPFMKKGELRMVTEATPREFEAVRRLLPEFAAIFQVEEVEELSAGSMKTVLAKFEEHVTRNQGVEFEEGATELAYRLLDHFVRQEEFPGKAMRFFGEVLGETGKRGHTLVDKTSIIDCFTRRTGLPELFLKDEMMLDEEVVSRFFETRIKGQDVALDRIYEVVRLFKAGLNHPGKPISNMVFAGPTGVGKTACARALAEYFFSAGQLQHPLVRLDMSEFQYPFQINRLIGSAGGSPGKLVEKVRERPFCVVLLDEIEKAHPAVFDALLGVLDEGVLYDAEGRATDFRSTIVIMTTNLGSGSGGSLGFGEKGPPDYRSAIQSFFRPEFYNRLDSVTVFKPLGPEVVAAIVRKELSELEGREGFEKRGIKLKFSPRLVDHIVSEGFDADYGARPLQRTIEHLVVSSLAKYLLRHPRKSNCTLSVNVVGKQVKVTGSK